MQKNGGSDYGRPMVEIVDPEEAHGFLIPLAELKFLPRIGDTIAMPASDSGKKRVSYEVIDVRHTFGISSEKRGMFIGISVGLKKLQ